MYLKAEYLDLADSNYKKALQLDPNNAHAHAVYGRFPDKNRQKQRSTGTVQCFTCVRSEQSHGVI